MSYEGDMHRGHDYSYLTLSVEVCVYKKTLLESHQIQIIALLQHRITS